VEILPQPQQVWSTLWAVRTRGTEAECGGAPAVRQGGFCMKPPPPTPQATGRVSGNQPSRSMNTLPRPASKVILGFRCLHLLAFPDLGWDSDSLHPSRPLLRRLRAFGVRPFSPDHCRGLKSHGRTGQKIPPTLMQGP